MTHGRSHTCCGLPTFPKHELPLSVDSCLLARFSCVNVLDAHEYVISSLLLVCVCVCVCVCEFEREGGERMNITSPRA